MGSRLAKKTRLIEQLTTVLSGPPKPETSDVAVAAFVDVWCSERRGMSRAWKRRATMHWESYFWANLAEAVARRQGVMPATLDGYFRTPPSTARELPAVRTPTASPGHR
ncbi:terpene synthase family protein [Streptomyces sp. NPDC001401]|uniref:terpene synthase family protein n=1 Tax=Streptomyces sp. NPDC001401 TaxID=3364570 RepID=UPI0036AF45FC